MSRTRFIFPVFNAVIFAMLFGILGYALNAFWIWTAAGVIIGFGFAWAAESTLKHFIPDSWLFRRRVILIGLLEIIFVLYGIGPFAYVQASMRGFNYEVCCQTPADLGLNYATLSIPSEEGISIAAWYIAPENPDLATIIVSHGAGGNRMGGLWYAGQLAASGFGVLLYDQRGLGESIGGHPSLGRYDTLDLPHMIDYLQTEYGVNPDQIGGVGLSLGANLLVTGAFTEERLAALWLDGLSPQHAADFPPPQSLVEQFEWSLNYAIMAVLQWQTGLDFPPLIEQINQMEDRSIMIVAGGADEFEVRSLEVYLDDLPEHVETWIIPGVGHNGGAGHDPQGYSTRMTDFFRKHFAR